VLGFASGNRIESKGRSMRCGSWTKAIAHELAIATAAPRNAQVGSGLRRRKCSTSVRLRNADLAAGAVFVDETRVDQPSDASIKCTGLPATSSLDLPGIRQIRITLLQRCDR